MITCIAIDDDPLFLKSLQSYFWEYEELDLVATYKNPVDGIMNLVKIKPDVLLLDLEMPYLDGFEALDSLDKIPKVIMISAHVNLPTKNRRIKVDKYIRKVSLNKDVLRDAILEVMTDDQPIQ